jgi:hypothetical protein
MHTPRILLIRADDDTHRGLRASLERRGCQVFEATTQTEAFRVAAEVEADLVVQENPVRFPARAGAFDETIDAVRVLAGPFPADVADTRRWAAAPRTPGRAAPIGVLPREFHARALLATSAH